MRDDANVVLGMHVRLLPDFYMRTAITPRNWTGVITEVRKSATAQPTKYVVLLDAQFHLQTREVEALDYELQQL
jgi:hypothetical protein